MAPVASRLTSSNNALAADACGLVGLTSMQHTVSETVDSVLLHAVYGMTLSSEVSRERVAPVRDSRALVRR